MNAAILQRLIWKEYRVLRSFWVATLVLAACAAGAWRGLASWYERPVQGEDFFILAAVVTSLFALGAGATSFATEHEVGTAEFLRRLPLDGRNLLCGKLLLSAVSVIGLKAVLWTGAAVLSAWFPVNGERLRTIWWCSFVSELELFAWGTLFSLLTRQPLMAITWGITLATATVHLVPAMLGFEGLHSENLLFDDYGFALPGRAAFTLALLASVVWLSTKWIRSPQPLSVIPDSLRRLTLGRRRTAAESWLATTAEPRPSLCTANGQLQRLIWLQWRQSRLFCASLAVPFVSTCLLRLVTNFQVQSVSFLWVMSTGILWLGLGISVFHGQQAHFRFRFFAEHGISPARVWWGHQLAFLAPLTVSVLLTLLVTAVDDHASSWSVRGTVERFGGLLLLATIVFTIGQLSGILVRQGLVAGAMGLINLLMHFCWAFLLGNALTQPFSELWVAIFGFVPLPLAWLWATRQHVSSWILERRTWATRLRMALCLVVPWMLMAAGLMTYRALEIPNVGVEPPTREQMLTLCDEERQTAEMYQTVIKSLGVDVVQLTESYVRKQSNDEREKQMLEIDQRIQQSPEILTRVLAATHRPVGAFAGVPQQQNAAALLIRRVLHRAELRASERQDINLSIALHVGIRRVLLHWRQNTDFAGLRDATILENNQIGRLMHQLRAGQWTPDRQRELAAKIAESSDTKWGKGRRAWEREFREAFDVLNGGDWPKHFSEKAQNDWEDARWTLWIPGERTRACRLLNAWHAIHTQDLGSRVNPEVWQLVQHCHLNTPRAKLLIDEVEKQGRFDWRGTTLRGRWQAIQVWLQMRAAKSELGRWPETFDGLAGLGAVKPTPGMSEYWESWIEYLPKGLIGERVTEPFTVRGLDHLPFEINGDEPCLVLFELGRERTEQVEKVRQAKDSEARGASLRGLRVEPLEPVPSAVGKESPGC